MLRHGATLVPSWAALHRRARLRTGRRDPDPTLLRRWR
jgi:hypothetical protein